MTRQKKQAIYGAVYILPSFLLMLAFTFIPICMTIYFSFTKYNLSQPPQWIGLQNYSKLITNYGVTDAAVHDSQRCTELLESSDRIFYADSAYCSKEIIENLPEGCQAQICEKGKRNQPLTDEQKKSNREKSKTRCRIEHIFGFITNSMHGITIRSIGITRAWFNIGLTNLIYNFCRYEFLKRPKASKG